MNEQLAEKLERRARCWLPAETTMLVECRADGGDRLCAQLLDYIQRCGLEQRPLCAEPYERIEFADRVLLRCGGCAKGESLPKIRAVGFGKTAAEAERNALYALTLPDGGTERRWGQGIFRREEESCIFNRVAYAAI